MGCGQVAQRETLTMDLESTDNGTDRILWCWLGLKSVELEPVGGLDSASVTAPITGSAKFNQFPVTNPGMGGWEEQFVTSKA
ncbi:hypothetical protein THAOC_03345, partial [Thalassiosira oceanica]